MRLTLLLWRLEKCSLEARGSPIQYVATNAKPLLECSDIPEKAKIAFRDYMCCRAV